MTMYCAPLELSPYPFRVDAKNLEIFSRKLAYFEADPSFGRFLGLVWQTLRT